MDDVLGVSIGDDLLYQSGHTLDSGGSICRKFIKETSKQLAGTEKFWQKGRRNRGLSCGLGGGLETFEERQLYKTMSFPTRSRIFVNNMCDIYKRLNRLE